MTKERQVITLQEAADELQYVYRGLQRYSSEASSNNSQLKKLINDILKVMQECEECDVETL